LPPKDWQDISRAIVDDTGPSEKEISASPSETEDNSRSSDPNKAKGKDPRDSRRSERICVEMLVDVCVCTDDDDDQEPVFTRGKTIVFLLWGWSRFLSPRSLSSASRQRRCNLFGPAPSVRASYKSRSAPPRSCLVSSSLAYEFAHLLLTGSSSESPVVCVTLSGSIYFPFNSALVAIIVGLVEGQPLKQVCAHCYEWVFPCFMVGIAFTVLVSGVFTLSAVWKGALILLPTMVLTCVYFLNRAHRFPP